MADHLTLDGVRALGPTTLGTPISVVFRSFQLNLVSISFKIGWVGSWEMIGVIPRTAKIGTIHMAGIGSYLKKHTEALVKDVGIEPACQLTGKSKATLGRYYSDSEEHSDRFMPVDTVARLEAAASYPHVTSALAELHGDTLNKNNSNKGSGGGINSDVISLSQRFAMLMGEYQISIEDGVITNNEAKRLLRETVELQKVLIDMKLHLEDGND
jgi:hypothetical protein